VKIISGGQTGVDRAALDVAIELGIPHGGWCPKGRRTEDGRIDDRYNLTESANGDYAVRTRQNVHGSQATLILGFRNEGDHRNLRGGTKMTAVTAMLAGKPFIVADLHNPAEVDCISDWLDRTTIACVNVAGPRESKQPGIYEASRYFLLKVFAPWRTI